MCKDSGHKSAHACVPQLMSCAGQAAELESSQASGQLFIEVTWRQSWTLRDMSLVSCRCGCGKAVGAASRDDFILEKYRKCTVMVGARPAGLCILLGVYTA